MCRSLLDIPTVWVAEGLFMYLDRHQVSAILRYIRVLSVNCRNASVNDTTLTTSNCQPLANATHVIMDRQSVVERETNGSSDCVGHRATGIRESSCPSNTCYSAFGEINDALLCCDFVNCSCIGSKLAYYKLFRFGCDLDSIDVFLRDNYWQLLFKCAIGKEKDEINFNRYKRDVTVDRITNPNKSAILHSYMVIAQPVPF